MTTKITQKYFFTGAIALFISGCLGSGVETPATEAIKNAITPSVVLGSPSSVSIGSSSPTTTVALTISNAVNVAIAPSSIGTVTTGTGVSCNISVTNLSDTSATVNLNACTGEGTIRVYVKANAVRSSTNTGNSQSTNSATITVDNTAPTMTSVSPNDANVATLQTPIVVAFDEPVDVGSVDVSDFTIGGDCSVLPTVQSISFGLANMEVNAVLTGETCTDSQEYTVTVDPSDFSDVAGNDGVGVIVTRTYTYDLLGPTVTLGVLSGSHMRLDGAFMIRNSASTDVDVHATVSPAAVSPLVIDTNSIEFSNGMGVTCAVAGANEATNGADITISTCTGDGNVRFRVAQDSVFDALANGNAATSLTGVGAIIADNTPPTVSSITAPSDASDIGPTTLTAFGITFSEEMDPTTLANMDLTIGGGTSTCAGGNLPTTSTSAFDVTNFTATFNLTAGSCAHGETLEVSFNRANVTDVAGNPGSGTTTHRTYTYDRQGPQVTFTITDTMGTVDFDEPVTENASTLLGLVAMEATSPCMLNVGTALTGAALNGTNDQLTFNIDSSACSGFDIIMEIDATQIHDVLNNAGTGTPNSNQVSVP